MRNLATGSNIGPSLHMTSPAVIHSSWFLRVSSQCGFFTESPVAPLKVQPTKDSVPVMEKGFSNGKQEHTT
jgi:hypothetical protein